MPAQPFKYQPYHGYYRKPWPWYWCPEGSYPRRIRTRSDWRWNREPRWWQSADRLNMWWRILDSTDSTYEKRLAHRTFRRMVKQAIACELQGDDAVSHRLHYWGDWLD